MSRVGHAEATFGHGGVIGRKPPVVSDGGQGGNWRERWSGGAQLVPSDMALLSDNGRLEAVDLGRRMTADRVVN